MTDIQELNEMMENENVEIKREEIKDGDLVIVKSNRYLSSTDIDRIKGMLKRRLMTDYPNIKIMILDEGIDLEIKSEEDES